MTVDEMLAQKVQPLLAEHGGGATKIAFENGTLYLRLYGACSNCPAAQSTTKEMLQEIVSDACSEVRDLVIVQQSSPELLELARKILRKDR